MADRSNQRLNEAIENMIRMWDGTIHGQTIRNMYENGSDYESICEIAGIEYEDYEEDDDFMIDNENDDEFVEDKIDQIIKNSRKKGLKSNSKNNQNKGGIFNKFFKK